MADPLRSVVKENRPETFENDLLVVVEDRILASVATQFLP
jgi:hypothetical protein